MRTRTALAVVVALLPASLWAAPAHAEYYSTSDPADAPASLTDVRAVRAKHGQANVVVRVRFRELTRSSSAGLSIFLDTDRQRRGPEYVLSSGLGDGTDYVLTEADGWRGSERRVDCDYEARVFWGIKDAFRVRIARECLDTPGTVRVSVKMVDPAASRPVVDWSPEKRRWSLPIASGRDV